VLLVHSGHRAISGRNAVSAFPFIGAGLWAVRALRNDAPARSSMLPSFCECPGDSPACVASPVNRTLANVSGISVPAVGGVDGCAWVSSRLVPRAVARAAAAKSGRWDGPAPSSSPSDDLARLARPVLVARCEGCSNGLRQWCACRLTLTVVRGARLLLLLILLPVLGHFTVVVSLKSHTRKEMSRKCFDFCTKSNLKTRICTTPCTHCFDVSQQHCTMFVLITNTAVCWDQFFPRAHRKIVVDL